MILTDIFVIIIAIGLWFTAAAIACAPRTSNRVGLIVFIAVCVLEIGGTALYAFFRHAP